MTPRERIEIFHLLFVRLLYGKLEDRARVALKGGGNLRFFFGSPRFSEDLDFDVRDMATRTLASKIDGIFEGSVLSRLLLAQGLRVETRSAPKQTDLVQRWKASIIEGAAPPESTKLEFSRRPSTGAVLAEPIRASVLERHRLAGPILMAHYDGDSAARQKVEALLGRSVPQTRDVFDLNLLLDQGARLASLSADERREATERVASFTHDEFEGQVIAFLEPDDAEAFASEESFDAMRLRVIDAIEAAR